MYSFSHPTVSLLWQNSDVGNGGNQNSGDVGNGGNQNSGFGGHHDSGNVGFCGGNNGWR